MTYPRQLTLSPDVENALKIYLDTELSIHYTERTTFIDDLIEAQKDYWAKPAAKQKTFPFTGAANIIIPLAAITAEAVHARTMATLFGSNQRVSAKSVNTEWQTDTPIIERYLDHELDNQIKFRDKIESSILEIEKLGTGVGKSGYERIIKYGTKVQDGIEYEFPVVVKKGVCLDTVPLARYVMPFADLDPQLAKWCGEEHSDTAYSIWLKEQSGLFYEGTYEKVINFMRVGAGATLDQSKYERSQELLEDRQFVIPSRIDWHEIWLPFDIDESGFDKEIVVHYHRDSRTLMSVRYNWHDDLRRPYRTGVYFPVEHRWTGIGIAKQTREFQREITTQHRQRLDNATIANIRMFRISRLSGYGPKEPIFPGKMWFLDDMAHVDTLQMGEIYPSSFNNESATLQYHQQRVGINELFLGLQQSGTPGTATSDLERIREGTKKFTYLFGNIRKFCNSLLLDCVRNLRQFGPSNIEYLNTFDNPEVITKFLSLPDSFLRDQMVIEITLTEELENNIVERQNLVQTGAMMQQYFVALIEIAKLLGSPQLIQLIATRALSASTEIMKQILETTDKRNIDRLIIKEFIDGSIFGNNGAGGKGIIQPRQAGLIPRIAAPNQEITPANY